jgi:hypothetical protein
MELSMKTLLLTIKAICLAFFIAPLALAQSATISQVIASPTYPPSITVKAAPAQGYTHVEIQLLRNGHWSQVASQQGQAVVNALIHDNGAVKVRVRGRNANSEESGNWVEHSEGYRFAISAGEASPPPVGPLCVSKTETKEVKFIDVKCPNQECATAISKICRDNGGRSSGGGSCYKDETTTLTCT